MNRQAKDLAFWGRVSTEDNQDPESSHAWQLTRARTLIEPHGGRVVDEFFDIDKSRSIPPQRRPEASRLLAALADPNRGFDAVVVGEPQRAFYGNQFGNAYPLFAHYGVPLWVPEVGGPINPDNEAHDLIMSVFGGVSKGERNRIRVRVRTAMAAQAQLEGRYLGGRPPYGYKLIDAGSHPNPAKAADGKRLHALAVDEPAAAVVERIFRDFLAGYGIFAIAELLTAEGIPSPSAHDPGRNKHRCGLAWSKSAIRAILLNPRYTSTQKPKRCARGSRPAPASSPSTARPSTTAATPPSSASGSPKPRPASSPPRPAHSQAAALLTSEEIAALVNTITDIVTVLRDADPHDKADLYSQLGLKLTYNPSARTVTARANLGETYAKGRVRGASAPISQCVQTGEFELGSAA